MKDIVKILRPHHYIKNFLIFLPIIFAKKIFDLGYFLQTTQSFIAFCLIASAVYVINDYFDIEADKRHPKKKNRPLASGRISKKQAKIIIVILLLSGFLIAFYLKSISILLVYLIINILYSIRLKHVAIFDIAILASGFVLRVILGSVATGVLISNWLYLTILSFSFYLAVGKRNGELKKNGSKSRKVLKYYNNEYLNNGLNIFMTLTLVFYSLWANDGNQFLLLSIPFVILIVLKYSLNISKEESFGDPIDVFLSDKNLLGLVLSYSIYMMIIMYGIK